MEELDLRELFYYFKSKVVLIVIIFLLVVTSGLVYSVFLKTPLYKSTSSIVLVSNTVSEDSLKNDIVLNEQLVDTYKEIVKSRSVLEQAINELDLKMSYNDLLANVSVDAVLNTEVIKISVVNEDIYQAAYLVGKITDIFSKEVRELYNIENIKVLDIADTPNKPYNVNLSLDLVIYLILGLVIAIMLIVIMYCFDKSIKSVEQIEAICNITVIGAVPLVQERGGKLYE